MADNDAATSDKPLGLVLHAVITYLRQELRSVASEELKQAVGADPDADAELRANLLTNPRVLHEPDGRWRWRSKYYLRNRDDLVNLLRRTEAGIPAAELFDAYKGARDDIVELARHRRPPPLLLYRATDSAKDGVLFANDTALYMPASDAVRELWHATPVPDALVVHNYLVQRGLKDASADGSAHAVLAPRKRPRPLRPGGQRVGAAGNRRFRLTNVHLEGTGIDLSRDYEPPQRP